eukprot:snap_masked-scaffold_1-processed-gene-18.17-mRNA-1 protein AED:1.00 eAED:1.00 QI:0/0/0/0/1/1/2/0/67
MTKEQFLHSVKTTGQRNNAPPFMAWLRYLIQNIILRNKTAHRQGLGRLHLNYLLHCQLQGRVMLQRR